MIQLEILFFCGIVAGVICVIVSIMRTIFLSLTDASCEFFLFVFSNPKIYLR